MEKEYRNIDDLDNISDFKNCYYVDSSGKKYKIYKRHERYHLMCDGYCISIVDKNNLFLGLRTNRFLTSYNLFAIWLKYGKINKINSFSIWFSVGPNVWKKMIMAGSFNLAVWKRRFGFLLECEDIVEKFYGIDYCGFVE